MSQIAANILSEQQYLQIAAKEIKTAAEDVFEIAAKPTSFSSIENTVFQKVSPFYYRARVRLTLTVSEEFQPHFVLTKGLMEFNRLKEFSFSYDINQKTIETDIDATQIEALQLFLIKISGLLKQEIQFKSRLKSVLQFENHYKLEMAKVYSFLKGTFHSE